MRFGFMGRGFGRLGATNKRRSGNSPNRSISESGVALDTSDATGTFGASIAEIAAALDTPASTAILVASITETATATDASDFTYTAGGGGTPTIALRTDNSAPENQPWVFW